MPGPGVHYELILPNPRLKEERAPQARLPLTIRSGHTSWLELLRVADGSIHYALGADSSEGLETTFSAFEETYPGVRLGSRRPCPMRFLGSSPPVLLRARARVRHHYWPMRLVDGTDLAGPLLRALTSSRMGGAELLLQVLFRPTIGWERGWFSRHYETAVEGSDAQVRRGADARHAEAPTHVEIRVAAREIPRESAVHLLGPWISSWTSSQGGIWWRFERPTEKHAAEFLAAMRTHDIRRFAGRRVRRNVSAKELAAVVPIPWKERFPNLAYAGAPSGRAPRELLASRGGHSGIAVGFAGDETVCLPAGWNHLAILGRTRTGKSTLAQSIALEILRKEPQARVVVVEPTGTLIDGLVARLPPGVSEDTVEMDPSRNTFQTDGTEMVAVPLNLLHHPRGPADDLLDGERKAEKLSGDLLQAIKNAWGEETVGGRADFILRSVIQGLTAVEGTNLVDAYNALTEKETLRRLERLAAGAQLKSALRIHLPRLDYAITISSLDKVGKIATNPLLRKALCQRFAPVAFEQLLRHRLLLLNLGKGALGTEGAGFLGAIFLTRLWSALQERPAGGPPVYLVVDEFHNFAIPAFADMLSEGARLGLHVIAVTQYLNRVSERIRSALIGNADVWVLFPLGAEDMREGWRIVQGHEHGWRPEDLVSGLKAHEAAFYAHRTLLKVSTSAPAPAVADAAAVHAAIERSSRRYAQPEDSQASPLGVSKEQLSALLGALPADAAASVDELLAELGWSRPSVLAGLALGRSAGLLDGDAARGMRLLPKGRFFREAIQASRHEGEEHSAFLAEAAAFLDGRGIKVRIVRQEGGYLRPDAEFEWHGRTHNIEVESSSVAKHLEQIVRNARKAAATRRRCLLVVSGREAAERVAHLVTARMPDLDLWGEVGLVWTAGAGILVPYESVDRRPWGLLTGEPEDDERAVETETKTQPAVAASPPNLGDLDRVGGLVKALASGGRTWISAQDVIDADHALDATSALDCKRVGQAMRTLGLENRRVRRGERQVRLYRVGGDERRGPASNPGDVVVPTRADAPAFEEEGTLIDPINRHTPSAQADRLPASGSVGPVVAGPGQEDDDPDEEHDQPDGEDREEPLPAVPRGNGRVAQGVREAGVVDREGLGSERGDDQAHPQQDGP